MRGLGPERVLLTGVQKIIVDVVSSVPRDSLSEVGGQTVPEHDHLNPHQSQLLLFPLPVSVDNVVIGRSGYTSLKDEGEAPARAFGDLSSSILDSIKATRFQGLTILSYR